MIAASTSRWKGLALLTGSAALLAAALGASFAMWMDKGAMMLVALSQSGLAWCF